MVDPARLFPTGFVVAFADVGDAGLGDVEIQATEPLPVFRLVEPRVELEPGAGRAAGGQGALDDGQFVIEPAGLQPVAVDGDKPRRVAPWASASRLSAAW